MISIVVRTPRTASGINHINMLTREDFMDIVLIKMISLFLIYNDQIDLNDSQLIR